MKDPSSRLIKFRLSLEEYNYMVECVKGKENTVADALSRTNITSNELVEMNKCLYVMYDTSNEKREIIDRNKNESTNKVSIKSRPDQPKA